ncbi:MAG: hypothetical protein Q7O66_19650 [Dehalococcoidia bacterium]|nr:hypothetical protein [Dehalococcoidia bacterium]
MARNVVKNLTSGLRVGGLGFTADYDMLGPTGWPKLVLGQYSPIWRQRPPEASPELEDDTDSGYATAWSGAQWPSPDNAAAATPGSLSPGEADAPTANFQPDHHSVLPVHPPAALAHNKHSLVSDRQIASWPQEFTWLASDPVHPPRLAPGRQADKLTPGPLAQSLLVSGAAILDNLDQAKRPPGILDRSIGLAALRQRLTIPMLPPDSLARSLLVSGAEILEILDEAKRLPGMLDRSIGLTALRQRPTLPVARQFQPSLGNMDVLIQSGPDQKTRVAESLALSLPLTNWSFAGLPPLAIPSAAQDAIDINADRASGLDVNSARTDPGISEWQNETHRRPGFGQSGQAKVSVSWESPSEPGPIGDWPAESMVDAASFFGAPPDRVPSLLNRGLEIAAPPRSYQSKNSPTKPVNHRNAIVPPEPGLAGRTGQIGDPGSPLVAAARSLHSRFSAYAPGKDQAVGLSLRQPVNRHEYSGSYAGLFSRQTETPLIWVSGEDDASLVGDGPRQFQLIHRPVLLGPAKSGEAGEPFGDETEASGNGDDAFATVSSSPGSDEPWNEIPLTPLAANRPRATGQGYETSHLAGALPGTDVGMGRIGGDWPASRSGQSFSWVSSQQGDSSLPTVAAANAATSGPSAAVARAAIDRPIGESQSSALTDSAGQGTGRPGEVAPDQDLDAMALEVYALIRQRVALERERTWGRS